MLSNRHFKGWFGNAARETNHLYSGGLPNFPLFSAVAFLIRYQQLEINVNHSKESTETISNPQKQRYLETEIIAGPPNALNWRTAKFRFFRDVWQTRKFETRGWRASSGVDSPLVAPRRPKKG